jgi:hypothetical protein
LKNLSLIAIFLLISLISSANAQKAQSIVETGFNSLSLTIELSKNTFVPLEPIPIKFTLKNNTNAIITTHGNFDFNSNYVKFTLTNPDGSMSNIEKLSLFNCRCITKDGHLPPGEMIEAQRLLDFDLQRYFDRAGTYKIKATFGNLDGSRSIESGWITFSISQPTGNDLAAYEFLKKQKNLTTFLSDYDQESFPNQKAFLGSFPDSAYTDYVRFLVSGYYLFEKNYNAAQEQLLKLKENKNFVYSDKVNDQLKEISDQLSKN